MIFWCLVLIVFSYLSLAIDNGWLPFIVFRHLWNFLLLGMGIMLFLRIKGKENQGLLEHLESQIEDLSMRLENKRSDALWKTIDELEKRIRKLEGKR